MFCIRERSLWLTSMETARLSTPTWLKYISLVYLFPREPLLRPLQGAWTRQGAPMRHRQGAPPLFPQRRPVVAPPHSSAISPDVGGTTGGWPAVGESQHRPAPRRRSVRWSGVAILLSVIARSICYFSILFLLGHLICFATFVQFICYNYFPWFCYGESLQRCLR
jgi:hypothetical protein